MPMYTWVSECCEKEVTVVRSVDEIEQPPTEEESGCTCKNTKWKRIMCAPQLQRGSNWGPGKGYWLIPLLFLIGCSENWADTPLKDASLWDLFWVGVLLGFISSFFFS